MGTNYYATRITKPACECCGRPADMEELHIGKSSAGWVFALHAIMEDGLDLTTLDKWQAYLEAGGWTIKDEYGRQSASVGEFIDYVKNRKGGERREQRMYGPAAGRSTGVVSRGLTWDGIAGDFS